MYIKILSLPDEGKFIVGNYYNIEYILGCRVVVIDESGEYAVLFMDSECFKLLSNYY